MRRMDMPLDDTDLPLINFIYYYVYYNLAREESRILNICE